MQEVSFGDKKLFRQEKVAKSNHGTNRMANFYVLKCLELPFQLDKPQG